MQTIAYDLTRVGRTRIYLWFGFLLVTRKKCNFAAEKFSLNYKLILIDL